MLKKAGILVAATAAGLLAVSPLAFAGDKDHYGHGDSDGDHQVNHIDNERENNQFGLVNVGDVNALNDNNICPQIPVAAGVNILGILGSADADADADDLNCSTNSGTTQVNVDES